MSMRSHVTFYIVLFYFICLFDMDNAEFSCYKLIYIWAGDTQG